MFFIFFLRSKLCIDPKEEHKFLPKPIKYPVRHITRFTPLERWEKQFPQWNMKNEQVEPPSHCNFDLSKLSKFLK